MKHHKIYLHATQRYVVAVSLIVMLGACRSRQASQQLRHSSSSRISAQSLGHRQDSSSRIYNASDNASWHTITEEVEVWQDSLPLSTASDKPVQRWRRTYRAHQGIHTSAQTALEHRDVNSHAHLLEQRAADSQQAQQASVRTQSPRLRLWHLILALWGYVICRLLCPRLRPIINRFRTCMVRLVSQIRKSPPHR